MLSDTAQEDHRAEAVRLVGLAAPATSADARIAAAQVHATLAAAEAQKTANLVALAASAGVGLRAAALAEAGRRLGLL